MVTLVPVLLLVFFGISLGQEEPMPIPIADDSNLFEPNIIGYTLVHVATVPQNWFQAQHIICASYNRRLVEIHNHEQNIQVQRILRKYNLTEVWTSGNDLGEEDDYRWGFGNKIVNVFWSPESWDNHGGEQDCISLVAKEMHAQNWYDRECDNKYPFICEDIPRH